MKQIWSVIRFEFLTFAKNPAFIGMTIFMLAVAAIGPTIPTIVNMFGNISRERTILVVDHTGLFGEEALEDHLTINAILYDNIDTARLAVGEGRYNYAVELNNGHYILYTVTMGMSIADLQNQLDGMFRGRYRLDRFEAAGVEEDQTREILEFNPESEIMTIGPTGETDEDSIDEYLSNIIYVYFMSFVLYFGLLMGGQYLLTTVIREKSTKTMELLIVSCKANYLINGKVLGTNAAVLTQLLLMVIVGTLSMGINASLSNVALYEGAEEIFVISIQGGILAFLVIFFLLGYVMFSYIYAALASTVSRMEDANSVSGLPTILILTGFFSSIIGLTNPGAGWVVVLSHIPIFAPFTMFMRICMGTAANWEIAVSLVTQILTVGVLSWLGSRIYRMGTLMYGNKLRLRELFRAMRNPTV